jgi:hypothetical protein
MKTTLKTFIAIFCMISFSATINAQSSSAIENWKELKDFHKVMAQTFHPMEEGDFKPIKERSGELAEKARLLAESKVPAELSKPEILQAIKDLKIESGRLDVIVKSKADDQQISKTLTSLHETFHKIMGMCQPGDEHHEHEHGDSNHK